MGPATKKGGRHARDGPPSQCRTYPSSKAARSGSARNIVAPSLSEKKPARSQKPRASGDAGYASRAQAPTRQKRGRPARDDPRHLTAYATQLKLRAKGVDCTVSGCVACGEVVTV